MIKILIVDDQIEIRELLCITLKREDFLILQAQTGKEGIEIAKIEKPDMIIMDILMPGTIDGLEATKIIKNFQETKNSKIIILSGKNNIDPQDEKLLMYADDYLFKPFSPLELIEKVEKLLGIN